MMEKPKIDIDGDGDGDLSKGAVKIILGLIFDRERTLRSLGNEFDRFMKWTWILILGVGAFWLFVTFADWRTANAYIKEFATMEVLEKEGEKATLQLTETVENENYKIGWVTLLVYDKKEEQFVDSQVITAEQLDERDWQFGLKKKHILYLSLYSNHHEPLQDFKVDYGMRIKQENQIVMRHYNSNNDEFTYPRLEIPTVTGEGVGSYIVEEKELGESFKMRDWTPRDWSQYAAITEKGELVLANMTYAYCELEKNDEGNDISVFDKVLYYASPYQTSPYHEQEYGWSTPLEIAQKMKCKDLVEKFEEWW